MLVINAKVVGKITAAPMPIAARAAIRAPAESTCAATAEVIANTSNPELSQPRRPYRSLRLPADSSRPGHDKRVGIDNPLQLRRSGVEVA